MMEKKQDLKILFFWRGTVGFPGSHDDGTAIQAAIAANGEIQERDIAEEVNNIRQNPEIAAWINEFEEGKRHEKFQDIAKGRLIKRKVMELSPEEKLVSSKERIAISALSSDAGWCLLAGDEIQSTITKRSFGREDGTPFGGEYDDMFQLNLKDPLPLFIININNLFKEKLRESQGEFWVEIFYLYSDESKDKKGGMCFVRHIVNNENQKTADVIVVKLRPEFKLPTQKELDKFLDTFSEINKIVGLNKSNVQCFFIDDCDRQKNSSDFIDSQYAVSS